MRIELLLFLSILTIMVVLIACSVPRRATPALSPTFFPQMTLTMYDPQLVSRLTGEAAIAATILPPAPHLPEIDISPPRCYRTLSPQLTCLGYMRNASAADLAEISVKASFSGGDSAQSGEAAFSLEQPILPAGSRAPYRLQVPDLRAEDSSLQITLASARPTTVSRPALTVEDESGRYQPETNAYRYVATLRNSGAVAARDIRLIVTLENQAGAIVGFRAVDWQIALPAGAAIPVDLTISPMEAAAGMRHQVIVLAQTAAAPAELHLGQ